MKIPVSIFIPGENSVERITFDVENDGRRRFITDMMGVRNGLAESNFYFNLVEAVLKS